MSKLQLVGSDPLPKELATRLRELADAVENGAMTEFYGCYCLGEDYGFLSGSGAHQRVIMSTMMHRKAVDEMQK